MSLSPELYELIIESVTDYAIFMLDAEGKILSWNPGAAQVKGYDAAEIIGEHFSRFYTQEDRLAGIPARGLTQARDAGRCAAEGWRVKKDGTRFWASVVITRVMRNDELIGFVKITRDMSEQRATQLAALEAERRFRLLVQGVTDYAIYLLDPEGHITNWNAGAARIKGYAEPEILGQHFSRFYTPEDIDDGTPHRALERARQDGRYEAEGWRVRKDGSRFWAGVVIDAIYDEAGALIGFAKITRDLTDRRAVQLELEKSREQLFQSQKMEAIGQLTGGIAHDFNNLLTGITGSLDLIATRIAQGRMRELDRFVGAAKGAASRAAALTHRLLAFARRQTLDPKPTDANKLICGMAEMIRRTVGPEIKLETVLAMGVWPTLCDPHQLENAVLNLCINARDAMPEGGQLTIETANSWLDDRGARQRDMAPGQYLAVSVTDTGTGMPEDVVARAFDPFFTTKPPGQGTGLGLSMIYGFCRQSGGSVRIYSEVGEGTTVRIYLPRYTGDAFVTPTEEDASQVSHEYDGKVVLIVDDEPTVRMLVVEVGEELGCAVLEASDGAGALKLLDSDMPIDLLITDVGLPGGMNGRQVAEAARAKRPSLQVLFITGYAENAAFGHGLVGSDMQVLTKPFAMSQLAHRIQDII